VPKAASGVCEEAARPSGDKRTDCRNHKEGHQRGPCDPEEEPQAKRDDRERPENPGQDAEGADRVPDAPSRGLRRSGHSFGAYALTLWAAMNPASDRIRSTTCARVKSKSCIAARSPRG